MTRLRTRLLVLAGGLLLLVPLWMLATGADETEAPAEDRVHSNLSQEPEADLPLPPISREALFEHADDPERLEALILRAAEAGLLNDWNDGELMSLLVRNLASYSPETMARLVQGTGIGWTVRNHLEETGDRQLLLDVLQLLDSASLRNMIFQGAGISSPLFAPGEILATLESLGDLDEKEIWNISAGVRSRITAESDPEAKRRMVVDYLDTTFDHPQIYQAVATAALQVMTTEQAIEWLLASETELTRPAEQAFFRHLEPADFDQGIGLLHQLFEDPDPDRGRVALEALRYNYSLRDPKGAMEWILTVDPRFRTDEMLRWSMTQLKRSSEAQAAVIVESTSDPELRAKLQRFYNDSN